MLTAADFEIFKYLRMVKMFADPGRISKGMSLRLIADICATGK